MDNKVVRMCPAVSAQALTKAVYEKKVDNTASFSAGDIAALKAAIGGATTAATPTAPVPASAGPPGSVKFRQSVRRRLGRIMVEVAELEEALANE